MNFADEINVIKIKSSKSNLENKRVLGIFVEFLINDK